MPFATGAGPAIWCHSNLPDRHAFSGRGGYAFPLKDNRPGYGPWNIAPDLLAGLALNYGTTIRAEDVFDAILALLSAKSYTLRFAVDLEDTFPHIPFPADHTVFEEAVAVGQKIRAVQTFQRKPGTAYLTSTTARIQTAPAGPLKAGRRLNDTFCLCEDGTGLVSGVSDAVWNFSVSGYRVFPRWLDGREGLPTDNAILKEMRDIVGRITELIDLFEQADHVLSKALATTLSRSALGLAPATEE